ncbi:MAG: hypothetical protein NTW19_14330 [Planctomycetota bacterium]|nr:hypothetical protein [Planctomycetota bacterium]
MTFAFVVSLSAPSALPVTVQYYTANGTASSANDYVAATGTLTIPAGQSSGVVNVSVRGDATSERNETFVVNLSTPTNAALPGGTKGTGMIVTDDGAELSWNSLLSTLPAAVGPGGTFQATRDFLVSGAAAAQNFALQYRLSQNSVWGDADDIVLTSSPVDTVTLAADKTVGSHAATLTLTIPSNSLPKDVAQASYSYLLGKVDSGGVVPENDLNNVIVVAAPTTLRNPDISWTGLFTSPASIDPLGKLTVTRSFQVSTQPVTPNFVLDYRLSLDNVFGNADDIVLGTETISSAADKSVSIKSKTLTFTIHAATAPNNYVVLAKADSTGTVNESSEANNVISSASALAVVQPDVSWSALGVTPAAVDAGGKLAFSRSYQIAN